ncbi:unnamed protein product, partial [Rotaria sp. Silwood1]
MNCKLLIGLINLLFNGIIIRYVNLNIIGIANIRIKLYYRTILFISRESLRRHIPKKTNIHSIYHYINIIWLIIPIGLYIMLFSFFLRLFIEKTNNENIYPYYNQACFIYLLSSFIELLSEPFYLLSTITQYDYIQIYIELIASIIGYSIQTILIIRNVESSLLYYGYGYLIYSIIITSINYIYFIIKRKEERYYFYIISSLNDLLIKLIYPFVDHKFLNKTINYLKQDIIRNILIDGHLYIITIFSLISYEEQAIIYIIYLFELFFPSLLFSTIQQISFHYFQYLFLTTKLNRTIIKNNQFIQDDDHFLLNQKQDNISYYQYNRQPSTPN